MKNAFLVHEWACRIQIQRIQIQIIEFLNTRFIFHIHLSGMSIVEARKGTNHLYFIEKQERQPEYDSETANERSFDSHGSEVRDQGVQSGNGNIRQIVPRIRSRGYGSAKVKQSDHYKYVSPFVQKAEQKAQERARQYKEAKKRQPQPEWNANIAPTGSLFDPTIHKQEIFKLQPRKPAGNVHDQRTTQSASATMRQHETRSVETAQSGNSRSRMTIRSSGVSRNIFLWWHVCALNNDTMTLIFARRRFR